VAVPDGFAPYVTTARRFLFLRERAALRDREQGIADAFRARRLEQPGTALTRFGRLPGRATLAAAGVLAVEEVLGAGVDELVSYGLRRSTAEALITSLERIAAKMTTFQSGPHAGETYDEDSVELQASAAKTASFNTAEYELGDRGTLRLLLDATAISGSGASLHVQVETRKNSSDSWRVVDAFVLVTATGSQRRSMSGLDRYVRAACTIAGSSPSVTFSLTGEGV
jgi:hypothetical protein